MSEEFLTPESFMSIIEGMIVKHKINHIEAIVMYCDEHSLDNEDILPLITKPMKDKLAFDASECGYMKKESSLPM